MNRTRDFAKLNLNGQSIKLTGKSLDIFMTCTIHTTAYLKNCTIIALLIKLLTLLLSLNGRSLDMRGYVLHMSLIPETISLVQLAYVGFQSTA